NDRLRIRQGISEVVYGFDSNVHARVTRVGELDRNRLSHHFAAFDRLITVDDLMVSREQQFNSRSFAPRLDLPRHVEHFIFHKRLAYRESFSLEKRVS